MVANQAAFEKVKEVAEAAGLTLEQLADLVVDSGVAALPPSDGVTRRYTLEDLGKRLWAEMQERPRSARAEWFRKLNELQQRAVIVVLRHRGFASQTIANEFELETTHVSRVFNAHADELGGQVVGVRLNTIAGQMQLVAEKAMEIEFDKGNGRAAWAIEKERIGVLQSIGVVEQAVHKSEVTHKLDDAARAEIDALIALEQKKLTQRESIKLIEAEVFDVPPKELESEDE